MRDDKIELYIYENRMSLCCSEAAVTAGAVQKYNVFIHRVCVCVEQN